MTRARQPDRFPRQPPPTPRTTETARGGYADFDFVTGPECEPRPDWVIPAELRLPTDPEPAT